MKISNRTIEEIRGFPGFRLLSNMDSDWTPGSGGSHNAASVPSIAFGDANLSLTTPTTGATKSATNRPFSNGRSVDATGKQIGIIYKITGLANINAAQLDFGDDSLANRWRWTFLDDNQTTQYAVDGEWTLQTLNFADGAITGTPNRAAITGSQIRISAQNGEFCTIEVATIFLFDEPARGIVTLSFDDGYESVFNKAYPVLDRNGLVGTVYMPEYYENAPGRMSSENLCALSERGWEIGGHGLGSDYRADIAKTISENLNKQEAWNLSRGFTHNTYAYPGGEFGLLSSGEGTVENQVVGTEFIGARTISQTTVETLPPANPFRLRVIYLTNAVAPATVIAAIQKAAANKQALHIAGFHNIVDSGAAVTTEYNLADLVEICEALRDADLDIRLIKDSLSA